jgi:hypothetical protein
MLTVDQVKNLALDRGFAVLENEYSERDEVWRTFIPASDIITPSPDSMTDYPYGHRSIGRVGIGEMKVVGQGQRLHQEQLAEGYQRQVALKPIGASLSIDEDMMKMRNAAVVVMNQIVDWSTEVAQAATRYRNGHIAGILQKGTIATATAASTVYFDQRYPGQADANLGYIYDGKPLFAASGNAHTFKEHTATGSQGVNLIASDALTSTTLDNAYVAMTVTNAINERGQPMQGAVTRPRFLLVPPALRQTAISLTESELLPGGSNNDKNANMGLVTPIVWSELTDDANAWWMLAEDPGLRVFDSGIPDIVVRYDADRRQVIMDAMLRFGAYTKDWRGMSAHNKATS